MSDKTFDVMKNKEYGAGKKRGFLRTFNPDHETIVLDPKEELEKLAKSFEIKPLDLSEEI